MTSTVLLWIRGLSWSDPNVRGAAAAALLTVVLLIALKLLGRIVGKMRSRYQARIEAGEIAVKVQRWEMISARGIERSVALWLRLLHLVGAILLIDLYVTLVLRLFPSTTDLSNRYFGFVMAPIKALWEALAAYLPNAVEILAISVLTLLCLRFFRLFFRAIEAGAVSVPGFFPDWSDPTYKLVRALVLLFLLIRIFPLLPGADEQAFKAVSVFVGALLTLGSTAAVGNAIAGVVLTYTRAFQVGDWIRVGRTEGEVARRTLLVTRLRTAENEQVTIPNGEVLREHVVNFTPAARRGRLGFTTSVTLGYDIDWRTVSELLLEAAAATEGLSAEPPPSVFQTALDNYTVSYTLRVFTSGPPPIDRIHTALRRNILDGFNRAGVEILSPSYSVLRSADRSAIPKLPDDQVQTDRTSNGETAETSGETRLR